MTSEEIRIGPFGSARTTGAAAWHAAWRSGRWNGARTRKSCTDPPLSSKSAAFTRFSFRKGPPKRHWTELVRHMSVEENS